jgi:hypothetical protein
MVKTLTDKNFANGAGIKFIANFTNFPYTNNPARFIGDVNGDGYQDIAFSYGPNSLTVNGLGILYGSNNLTGNVYIGNSLHYLNLSNFNSIYDAYRVLFYFSCGDITDDGIDDILLFNNTNNYDVDIFILPGNKLGPNITQAVNIGSFQLASTASFNGPNLLTNFAYGNVIEGHPNSLILTVSNFNGSSYILVIPSGPYIVSGSFNIYNFTSIIEAGGWVINADYNNFSNVTSVTIFPVNIGDLDADGKDDPIFAYFNGGRTYNALFILKGGQSFTDTAALFEFNYDYFLYTSQKTERFYSPGNVIAWYGAGFAPIITDNFKGFVSEINYYEDRGDGFSPNCLINFQDLRLNYTTSISNLLNCSIGKVESWLNFYTQNRYGDGFVGFIGDFLGNYKNIIVPEEMWIKYPTQFYVYPLPTDFSSPATVVDQINQFGFYSNNRIISWGDFNGNGTDILTWWSPQEDGNYACLLYFKGMDNLQETNYEACSIKPQGTYTNIELCNKTSPQPSPQEDGLGAGAIVGIALGSVVALGIAAAGMYYSYKHHFSQPHETLLGTHNEYGTDS